MCAFISFVERLTAFYRLFKCTVCRDVPSTLVSSMSTFGSSTSTSTSA